MRGLPSCRGLRRAALGLLAGLLIVAAAPPGEAFAARKAKAPRARRHAERAAPLRHAPRLEFLAGTLTREPAGRWSLGGQRLLLGKRFLLVGAGERGRATGPVAGQRVLLSGVRTARGFRVEGGVALRASRGGPHLGDGSRPISWGEADPQIGVSHGPGPS